MDIKTGILTEKEIMELSQRCQDLSFEQAKKRLSCSDHMSDSESVSTVPGSPITNPSENLDMPIDNASVNGYPESLSISKESRSASLTSPDNDIAYECTTNVVKAVMELLQGVQRTENADYLDLVKHVGIELRTLLATVDQLVPELPSWSHKEIEMAHSVLSKDMVNLVDAMKQAQKFQNTTLDGEYRKQMLSAAHALAMDAKNLFDVIKSVKIRMKCSEDGPPLEEPPMEPIAVNPTLMTASNLPIEQTKYYNVEDLSRDQ